MFSAVVSGVCQQTLWKKTAKVVSIIIKGGIDMAKARKFYESESYQAAKAVRDKACDTDLFLAEGV